MSRQIASRTGIVRYSWHSLIMRETSARLLRLLSLLQMRREWSGTELAERLQITTRTVRRDVEKLRYLFSDRYVVQLFEVGWEAEPPYYVMEHMENGSLEDLLRAGPISVPDAVLYFREIAVALVHAHDKGILHCDLKPANVLLDTDRRPRLGRDRARRERRAEGPC